MDTRKILLQEPSSIGRPWALMALPRAAWQSVPGGCCCRYCTPDRQSAAEAFYDTATFYLDELTNGGETDYGLCHAPEVHGAQAKRKDW